jgi:predicted O-methyltransferase YrrM
MRWRNAGFRIRNVRSLFAFFWRTFWRLPKNRRWNFLGQLPLLRHELPRSFEQSSPFAHLNNYSSDYSQLAALLGQPGKTPPQGELEFLRSIAQRPMRYHGPIGISEALFITAFAGILAPARVIEIGTLTGFSAAIIAAALRRQHGKEGAVVETIDFRRQCIIDEAQPTGFEIPQLVPDLVPMIRLHVPHDSSFVAELAQPNELSMIFIDADHRHPYVLLDVLRVAPYLREAGWIVLHDIQLGLIGEEMRAAGEPTPWGAPYGVQWLFERWPFRKISGGNVGAIQLPAKLNALIPFALRLMSVPFESEAKTEAYLRAILYQTLGELA